MSNTRAQEIYEKMLKKPENRTNSAGQMKQPSPFDDPEISGSDVDTSKIEETPERADISPEEQSYLSEIDRRMALRKEGKLPGHPGTRASAQAPVDESRIDKLENQVKEMEELLIEIMKAQMKLLNG